MLLHLSKDGFPVVAALAKAGPSHATATAAYVWVRTWHQGWCWQPPSRGGRGGEEGHDEWRGRRKRTAPESEGEAGGESRRERDERVRGWGKGRWRCTV